MLITAASARWALILTAALTVALLALLVVPELAAAQGNPLEKGARNALTTAQVVLGAVFTILLAFVCLRLFAQKNFGGLAVTLLVGSVVAWVIFNPANAGKTLESAGSALFN